MRIRVKIILALLIGTFCFTTYGVQAANVQASKEKMSGYGRSEKARKELKKRKKSKKADVSPVKELTPEQQRRYDYFFLEAARLKVQKDYDAAFDVLQHCLTINPNASSALYEMAQYYMYLKQVPLDKPPWKRRWRMLPIITGMPGTCQSVYAAKRNGESRCLVGKYGGTFLG